MNRVRFFTLLVLAVIVIAFAVTWSSLPSTASGNPGHYEQGTYIPARKRVSPPSSWFASGLLHPSEAVSPADMGGAIPARVELHALKQRIVVVYGCLAVVVILLGLAFGAGRRLGSAPSDPAPGS